MSLRIDIPAQAMRLSGLSLLLRHVNRSPGVLALAYHRIARPGGNLFDRDVCSVTPEDFDEQVALLKESFTIIGPGELAEVVRRRTPRCAMITFDDGYRDNYELACPILRSHGVGATFFIATGFIDRPRASWWDEIAWMVRNSPRESLPASPWWPAAIAYDEPLRLHAVRRVLCAYKLLPPAQNEPFLEFLAGATGAGRCPADRAAGQWMTWDMIRSMRDDGMWIGGHTVDHPILARLGAEEQWQQIAGCARRIEQELGQPMRWFAYPRGKEDAFDNNTREALRRQGVEFAFSYYGGFSRFDSFDAYDIRRSAIELDVLRPQFQAMVALPQVFA